MSGCLPDLKRLLNPNKQRPYLPPTSTGGDSPAVARASISAEHRDRAGLPASLSRTASSRDTNRPSSSRTTLVKSPSQGRPASRNRLRSQSLTRPKDEIAQANGTTESRPTGLFAGVKLQPAENAMLAHGANGSDQRLPRTASASTLRSAGTERARHNPIREEQIPREQGRVLRFQATATESCRLWPQPTTTGQRTPLVRHATTGILERPGSSRNMPGRPSTAQPLQMDPVELPGDFTDVMEKEVVVAPPTMRQAASYDTLAMAGRTAISRTQSSPASALGLGQPGLAHVVAQPGSASPSSRNDSFGFAVELPGSSPVLAEKDAGPLPPTELPGSVPFPRAHSDLAQRSAGQTLSGVR